MTNERFSDRLIESEQMSPGCRERYEKEVKAMLLKTLTPAQRIGWWFSTIMCFGFFVGFGYVAITAPKELPTLVRASFALGSVFGLIMAIVGGRIAYKGVMHRRNIPNAMTGAVWGFVVLLTVAMLLVTGKHPDSVRSVYMVLTALVYFIMGLGFLSLIHI